MNLNQFKNTPKILEKLLVGLNILSFEKQIIRINNFPDFDMSDYRKGEMTDYSFRNFWDFSGKFQSIIDVEIIKNTIFHSDNLHDLSKEYNIEYDYKNNCDYIFKLYNKNEDIFLSEGMGTDVGEFKLHSLRISSIDNFNKKLYYEGSFVGDDSDMDSVDWGIYSLLKLTTVSTEIKQLPFYKTLISESYELLNDNKLKIAYFIIFSAFESFVNYELGNSDEKERLKRKTTLLFKQRFPQLEKNKIYSSVIAGFKTYTRNRNTIAHGKEEISISQNDVYDCLLDFLILISSYEFNCTTFEDLISNLQQK